MAISDAQKVDYLLKKIGYGISKTDTSTNKSPANESVASPLLLRGDNLYAQSDQISVVGTLPSSNSSVVTVYRDSLSSAVLAVNDGTAATNRTWKTNLTDWIGPEFGSGYAVKVYTGTVQTAANASSGTSLPVDGSGNNDSWFFDYQSGVLNFADTNVPSSIAAQVWVVGARYTGQKGVNSLLGATTVSTANVSLYDNVTAYTTNQTFYPQFSNISTTGNSQTGVSSSFGFNPSTGTITATVVNAAHNGSIGATTPNTAVFTTATTGGLQAVAIGNATPGTGAFTTLTASGATTVTSSTASTSTGSGALVVTGGTGIGGNLYVGGITALNGNVTIGGNLTVTGNSVSIGASTLSIQDPIISLNTPSDLTPLTVLTTSDIGVKMHYYDTSDQHAFLGRAVDTGYLEWYARGNDTANVFTGTVYGTVKTGGLWLNNTTVATGTTSGTAGALYVAGGAGIAGNVYIGSGLQATAIGNVTPGSGAFTTASTTGNLTVGGNIAVTGNIVPSANITYSLGTSSSRFKDIWLSGQTEYLGGAVIGEDASGNLTLTASGGNRISIVNTAANSVVMTGNVVAPYHLGNIVGTIGTISVATIGGLQAQAIGNVTPGTGVFTTGTFNTATTGGLQAVAIGNVTPGSGAFTTVTTSSTITSTGNIVAQSGTASTSSTTGALVVNGGAGITGNINAGISSSIHILQGNLLIGLGSPASADTPFTINQNSDTPILAPNAISHVSVVTGKPGFYGIDTFGTFGTGFTGGFLTRRARGTSTSPTAVQIGDYLGQISFRGYGATGYTSGVLPSGLRVGATDNFTDSAQGTFLELLTVPAGTTSASPVVFVEHNGNVVLNSTTQSTGAVTGALVVKGGVGIGANLNVTGNLTVNGGGTSVFLSNVDVQTTLYGRGVYDNGTRVASTSGGPGNVSIVGGNVTLPLTGPGAVQTGSGSQVPVITTDAYGRISSITTALVSTAVANTALYASTTQYTTNQTFYPMFSNLSTTGNTTHGVATTITFNPGTGALGTTLLNTSGVITSSGNIVAASGTNSTSATTGAITIAGNGGLGVTGNAFFGNSVTINSTQTAGQDFIVRGKNSSTTLWVRPSATYDQVLIGGNATPSTFYSGAALQINTTDSLLLPVGSTAQRPSGAGFTDTTGMLRYSTTTGAIEWYTGSAWQSASTQFTLISDDQFNGDGSTVAFTMGAASTTSAAIVSINGVIQIPTLAYSCSSTTLTFTEAPASGDVIDVRRLTTTQSVTSIASTNGYMQFVTDNSGAYVYIGSAGSTATTYWDTAGAKVSALANTAVASANTATTIDTMATGTYRSAKYIIQATNGANYQVMEALMISNGTTATVLAYGTVQTNGNLGVVTATQSGSDALLQFVAANSSTNVRITKDYLLI